MITLLNLSLGELLAIFLPVAAGVVALYLYDRSRRRQVVSTLRFFRHIHPSPVMIRRKKIQQPWSLLLQLVCLALLLLALAEPEWGKREAARDHVLILETSAWMNARAPGSTSPLMGLARRGALDYLRALPPQDRVLLVRADALATPATPFTSDRQQLEAAIRAAQPGSTALNLSAALELARSAQKLSSRRVGEIAVVGSGRAAPGDLEQVDSPPLSNLRAILLGAEANNCGIRKLSARRRAEDPLEWQVEVGVHNYGAATQRLGVSLRFAGRAAGSSSVSAGGRSTVSVSFRLRTTQDGALEATLASPDDFRGDNRASIELPGLRPLPVEVYSDRRAAWEPLLTASRFLAPQFRQPAQYTPAGAAGRLVILDGFAPAVAPDADSMWIALPGAAGRQPARIRRWNTTHPLAAGLRDKDLRVPSAVRLAVGASDQVVAESEQGPILTVSSEGARKKILFGFHPLAEGLENHLAIPLLFANLARWVSPDLFRLAEVTAATPGLVELEVAEGTRRDQVRLSSAQIPGLAFTLVDNRLRFYAERTGRVAVRLPDREAVYSLELPEVAEGRWTPAPGVRAGVPPPLAAVGLPPGLWPWLAVAGALGLLAEWILFGRRPAAPAVAASQPAIVMEQQEVHS
jgi:hypothetical protein